MTTLINDLKHGLRILKKRPLFTGVAILTLALGIGSSVTIFSFVNAFLLRPLPYADAERLVDLTDTHASFGRMSVAYANFKDWQTQNQTFEEMACYRGIDGTLAGQEIPERIEGMQVNANLFTMLGIKPALGRLFEADDDHGQAARTVVLSHACWQQRFNAAPETIGQSMVLDGDAYTVIGVLPVGFRFPAFQQNGPEFWTPIGQMENQHDFMQRSNHEGTAAIGKLKTGVSLAQARTDINHIAEQLEQTYPNTNAGCRVDVNGFRDQLLGNTRFILTVFMGAVVVVLLIVCVNMANLMLVRTSTRTQEFSIRSALGAGRWSLMRQLLCENLALALLGGLGGLVVAFGGLHGLNYLLGNAIGAVRESLYQPDRNVLLFMLGTTLGTGLLFGLFPAWQAGCTRGEMSLSGGSRKTTASRAHRRLRDTLVVAEIALALMLLSGAGLMGRSFVSHLHADPGYNPDHAVIMDIRLSDQQYDTDSKRAILYQSLIQGIESLPGVTHAGLGSNPFGNSQSGYYVEQAPIPERGHGPHAEYNRVSPDYFAAMGIRLLEGRFFEPSDNSDAPPVVLADQRFAQKWWPNESALGKRLQIYRDRPNSEKPWAVVVGVVNHVKHYGVDQFSRESLFLSVYQRPSNFTSLVVRTQSNPLHLIAPIRQVSARIDPNLPVYNVRTLQSVRDQRLVMRRTMTTILGSFAAMALLLAALGIYGVTAYTVSQRTQEFGIRMALGACIVDILRLVLARGLKLAVPGILLGLLASFGLGWLIRSLLFGVTSWDPFTFVAVTAVLAGAVALACYIPARRATKIDPMEALRYE